MTPFSTLSSTAMPLLRDNVDTDAIIPSREMKSTGKTGLADGLFAPWRYTDADARIANPDFVLNDPDFADAQILLGGINFGCGSSREHAVWALAEYGIRAVIADSFAPIFENNCVRNGLLPISLDGAAVAAMAGEQVTINLPEQSVICGPNEWHFDIGDEAKTMLTEGLDAIDLTLKHAGAIEKWQREDRINRPYIYLETQP